MPDKLISEIAEIILKWRKDYGIGGTLLHDRELSQGVAKLVRGKIGEVIVEIQAEIDSRPQYPNIGKKGCIKRLRELQDFKERLGTEGGEK